MKGKIVQINPVLRTNTSTGRIMQEIGALAEKNGWKNYCAYSRGRDGMMNCTTETIPVGNRISTALHGLATRLADRHGLASTRATRRFVEQLRDIDPDIVHIHNIHGYFLDYRVLFDYLSHSRAKVIWTVHDCWLFTGHCYYYSYIGCNRWQEECHDCPQHGAFPRSIFVDRSRRNFIDKRRAFTSLPVDRMTIIPVSEWMKDELSSSFLKDYPMQVIHNGIDTDVFSPRRNTSVRKALGISDDKKIILGLASIWSREKGLDDFIAMSRLLADDEVIVLVGVDSDTARRLPASIRSIERTSDVGQLAELYSEATAFVNPTWQDNYPTVNLEAMSCGTPVVTYRTGGSVESIDGTTGGAIVEQGDVQGLLSAVRQIGSAGRYAFSDACRRFALDNFRKEERYNNYLELYDELIRKP
ncbi:MAG: glycosyltransferase [Bacteroidales bacterium]|nr:glycosyltransferase [Bacteroidales bacterium]